MDFEIHSSNDSKWTWTGAELVMSDEAGTEEERWCSFLQQTSAYYYQAHLFFEALESITLK